ncbi:hypothetical protein BZG35_07485 [Brevundimonas sp. LM2]|nr:hypothetical protein BZG35_07485 [Brevundimonas sp. LM2]
MRYYERRAQRQQTFLDGGSLITLIGAAGAFQGNITQQTREAWAVAAFTPSIISQFNVYEPTRELFHGGALAVQLITRRYERMFETLDILKKPPEGLSCALYSSLMSEIAGARQAAKAPVVYDPEGVLLGEVRRINDACNALAARRNTIIVVARIATDRRARLGRDYAWDLLTLDNALVAKDQQMRSTPIQTLTALVSSPLRAVDFAITGENAQNGLNALKTQVAFAGMNRSLMALDIPGLPTQGAVGPIAPLSERALALDTAGAPTDLKDHIGRLRALSGALEAAQFEQSYYERASSVLGQAISSDHLTFAYDATTNTTVVKVGPRPVEAGAIASSSTGQSVPGGGS